MSNIVTFYSFKGGVGRTMSLANAAVLLAKWGKKVLIVDWDLEAPGLEYFFKDFFDLNIVKKKIGVIELLEEKNNKSWQKALIPIKVPASTEPIHFISAGKRDENYFKKVRDFNVDSFYEKNGGNIIENLRNEWKSNYDFILIDSRTGVTEIGGICTVQLPDQVVLLFTATDQGFEGTLDIAKRALKAQQKLPFDRQKLVFLPILTKFDTQAEFQLSQEWISLFAERLKDIYADWLPVSLKKQEFLAATKIPYITYFSFGEKLPVIEQSANDPAGLTYAYENLAGLIANELNDSELLMISRDRFINNPQNEAFRSSKSLQIKEDRDKLKIFISYSHRDRMYKDELESYLSILSKKYDISFWSDSDLLAGADWQNEISKNLSEARIVLLLISPDYLSNTITMNEFKEASSFRKTIIPIIIRPSFWLDSPVAKFLALPRNKEPISNWLNKEQAYIDVVENIEKLIINI